MSKPTRVRQPPPDTTTIRQRSEPALLFEEFLADDVWRSAARSRFVADLKTGFEKWLATEWLLWLRLNRKLGPDLVGIEYKVQLRPHGEDRPRESKRIDLWWAAGPPTRSAWNFVELKVVFHNHNKRKMVASASWDLTCLSRIDASYERAAAAAAIVIGGGFEDDSTWAELVDRLPRDAEVDAMMVSRGGVARRLRWHSWTLAFSDPLPQTR